MAEAKEFKGKRVLVTGAASGIGLAIAHAFSSQGAEVVMSDLSGTALHLSAAEVEGSIAIGADLNNRNELHKVADACREIDILVNNAGLQHVSPIDEFPEERFDTILSVMVKVPFVLTKAALPGMYERKWGRIINIASVHGLVASPFKVAYVTAKHGLLGLTKTTALETAQRCSNVTAHAICPSYVRTPLVEHQIEAQAKATGIKQEKVIDEVLLAHNAVKKLISPESVAEAALFLCGESSWTMTGSALTMDAGWLAN